MQRRNFLGWLHPFPRGDVYTPTLFVGHPGHSQLGVYVPRSVAPAGTLHLNGRTNRPPGSSRWPRHGW